MVQRRASYIGVGRSATAGRRRGVPRLTGVAKGWRDGNLGRGVGWAVAWPLRFKKAMSWSEMLNISVQYISS